MHSIIVAYLFQNKTCPLPGMGTLMLISKPAAYDFANKLFLPPEKTTVFNAAETEADLLVDYIAAKQKCSVITAIDELGKYCNGLKQELTKNGKAVIQYAGTLFTDADNVIRFEQTPLPAYLQQPVAAEKVIHPEAAHTMLVGDRETTNLQMAEYYTESPGIKSYWWLWAIILFAIAVAAMLIYINQQTLSSFFGNNSKVL